MSGNGGRESKTVRRAKACNTCRRKKTRCDGKRPTCASCQTFGFSCVFQDVVKRSHVSNDTYIRELEARVQELESQLKLQNMVTSGTGLHENLQSQPNICIAIPTIPPTGDDNEESEELGLSNKESSPSVQLIVEEGQSEEEEADARSATGSDDNQASYTLNASDDGGLRFFGPSSGFSVIPSQSNKSPENQRNAERWSSSVKRGLSLLRLSTWVPQILKDDFGRRTSQELPSRQTTQQLVQEYFSTFNRAIPLFNESSFLTLVEKQFSWNPSESPSWWVSLNVALAFAYRERAENIPDNSENWAKSMGHIKNALNVLVEMFLRNADLLAVQGVLGLALFFQDTPNPQILFMLAAAAMRMSQSIGLHSAFTFGMPSPVVEERRRTYWIAFMLDADISHRTGRPSVQDINDYNTPLPSSLREGAGTLTIGETQINYFSLLTRLAVIQRNVYEQLYTTTTVTKKGYGLIKKLKDCEGALLAWKASIPKELQPKRQFLIHNHSSVRPVLRLHFAYHACYANLYWKCLSAVHSIRQLPNAVDHFPEWEKDAEHCLTGAREAARSSLEMIENIHKFGPSFTWSVICFLAAATRTIFTQIISNPHHPQARTDLSMARQAFEFLSAVSDKEPGTYLGYLLSFCSKAERAASQALAIVEQDRSGVPIEDLGSVGVSSNYSKLPGNSDSAITTHLGTPIPSPPSMEITGTNLGAYDSDTSPPFDQTSNARMDLEFPLDPFWNWQDSPFGLPSTFDFGNGQFS